MPKFAYVARDRRSRVVKGEIDALDLREARLLLREQGLFATKIEGQTTQTAASRSRAAQEQRTYWNPLRRKVKLDDLVVFCRQFATLVRSGLNLTAVMSTLEEQSENPALRRILRDVHQWVQGGESLGEAFGRYAKSFTPLFVSLVKAGETGGVLDELLEEMAVYFEKEQELRQRIRSAFTYPSVVMTIAIGVVIFLLAYVVPVFDNVYQKLGAPLPLPTIILIRIGNVMQRGWPVVLAALAGSFVFYQYAKDSSWGRPILDRVKLQVPVISNLVLKSSLARFSRTFALLVRSGVAIVPALEVVQKVDLNTLVAESVKEMQDGIREGESIRAEMKRQAIFPPLIVQMTAVGEETGNLEESLFSVAGYYDREVDFIVRRLTTLLEPMLTLFLGVIVGFIAIALYLPIFSVVQMVR